MAASHPHVGIDHPTVVPGAAPPVDEAEPSDVDADADADDR